MIILFLTPKWFERRKAEQYMRDKLCETADERRLRELA